MTDAPGSPPKILLAPDKFKGSLTAAQVVHHLGRGFARRGISVSELPLADGGDGSVDAALHLGYRPLSMMVAGPTGVPHEARAALDGRTAIVEVANTCGLQALPDGRLAALRSSSGGLGEAIAAVLDCGTERVVVALGGSASTDGGAGLLRALGTVFRDRHGRSIDSLDGASLLEIASIDIETLPVLSGVQIVAAADVDNPLTGPSGAATVYGPQKGAGATDITQLEDGLSNLVACLVAAGRADASELAASPGAGAAGGLGFACRLLGGQIVSGADYFLDLFDFDARLAHCSVVITGEGRLDEQTLRGKLPIAVARRCGAVPVLAVVGRNDVSAAAARRAGFTAVHSLADVSTQNTSADPALSGRLLERLAETMALPSGPVGCRLAR